MSTTTKEVVWSYPTSPNAVRFGFAKVGCWSIDIQTDFGPLESVSGHATRKEAHAKASALPHPWSWLYLKYNPQDA